MSSPEDVFLSLGNKDSRFSGTVSLSAYKDFVRIEASSADEDVILYVSVTEARDFALALIRTAREVGQ